MVKKLEDKLDYLADTKELLRQKLNEKGVTVSSSDTFRSYANKILELPSKGQE